MRVCLLRGWSGEWQEEGRRLASGQPPRFASGDCCCRYPHPWNCITNSTSEPDLSELTPIRPRAGQYLVLDWSALPQNEPRVSKTGTAISAGAEVQALGYMMDGDRSIGKNQWVQDFVLLPEAGTLLHPAHRIRDQMIAVHLEDGARIQFSPRALVWVWGNLKASAGLGRRSEALYMIERARAKPAEKADIQRYFK